jgi:4-amino-4-deoxy-L-arabinose transferase-like glycosyltransferase
MDNPRYTKAPSIVNTHSPALHQFTRDLWPVLLAGLVLWALLPGLYFGNLHTDTLEAAYWGRDLAWGYSKHPPVVSWLLSVVFIPGTLPILTLLIFGQGLAFLSAWFVYDLIFYIAGRGLAILAACLMMVTSVATFYAPQINHNTVLIPFCAATMAYGYRYLDQRKWRDAVGLGLATGLGVLTKYEILFALMPLFVLSVIIPRFRSVYWSPKTVLSMGLTLALLAPHLVWLSNHGWTSLSRAVGSAPMESMADALFSVWGLFIGFVAVIAFPLILIALLQGRARFLKNDGDKRHDIRLIGQIFLFVPLFCVGLASLLTDQYIKALWLLPLTPSAIVGVALLVNPNRLTDDQIGTKSVRLAIGLSVVIAGLFHLYLLASDVIDQPVESYLADTRPVSEAAQKLWSAHSTEKLTCIVSDESKLSISPVLWIASRPQILPLGSSDWITEARRKTCAETGGIAVKFVLDGHFPVEEKFPNVCHADAIRLHVPSVIGLAKTGWDAEIMYIAPNAHPDCAK